MGGGGGVWRYAPSESFNFALDPDVHFGQSLKIILAKIGYSHS